MIWRWSLRRSGFENPREPIASADNRLRAEEVEISWSLLPTWPDLWDRIASVKFVDGKGSNGMRTEHAFPRDLQPVAILASSMTVFPTSTGSNRLLPHSLALLLRQHLLLPLRLVTTALEALEILSRRRSLRDERVDDRW
jgi:hypothetical protein